MKQFVMRSAVLPAVMAVVTWGYGTAVGAQQTVTGAGASFPAPLYAKWAADYQRATGVQVNYQSIGSGAGVRQIIVKTVDFGASDAPLNDADLAQAGLVQFPTVIGGVVPVVNIPGIAPGQLKLTGEVLGDIYLGKIKRWNDAAIQALNTDLPLPDAAITPVRRADGSGSSFLLTHYLSKVNANWRAQVGAGTSVNWPTGVGGKGNEGVAAFVGRLPNAIGYVEYAYAKQSGLAYVRLQNAAGVFVVPEASAFQAAAAGADWQRSFYQILTNQSGTAAWPISGATFILMHKAQDKPEQAAAALQFFRWAYDNGDAAANALDYVPMPTAVKQAIISSWRAIDAGR